MQTVNQVFKMMLLALLVPALLVGYSLYRLVTANEQLADINLVRYNSYLLADELRQSSDDLTRLARTYVVNGDPHWERQYFEILDIRNGKKPRPQQYDKIYWDLRAAGIDPGNGVGETVSLEELMRRNGFSDAEFAKLKEAQANSNGLVNAETEAMHLVKGQLPDGKGGYSTQGVPDLAKARAMMHDKTYHQYKAGIMQPVNEFLHLLDQRTQRGVDEAMALKNLSYWWLMASISVMLVVAVGFLIGIVRLIMRRFGADPTVVHEAVVAIKEGDLSTTIQVAHNDTTSVMAALQAMRNQLRSMVADVRMGSNSVSTTANEIAVGNQDLSNRTETQAGALEQTASTMEELGSRVRQNAENALQANQLAQNATSVALAGGAAVAEVVETMKGINESSRKISEITSVIDSIAFQTNILALNAAVEAARAGEQGRGFAVVATEVRALAGRSADAAKQIKHLINSSVERVEKGSALVDRAGSTMSEMVGSVQRLTDIVGEISVATNEQANGIADVRQAVTQMDQVTQQNAALVEQMAAATQGLRSQAGDLVKVVNVFKVREPQALLA